MQHGHAVTTIEGLATNGTLHAVQQAFHEHHALQCGYCTSGMVLAATSLLAESLLEAADEPDGRALYWAAVVNGIRLGLLDSPVRVATRGGALKIAWHGGQSPVLMTGPAVTVLPSASGRAAPASTRSTSATG